MPRKLTIYIESPPGDGFRVAQDHFIEYVKPILASSGLDWDFIQGRRQGDVRAAVAERIRRQRRAVEADLGGEAWQPEDPTEDEIREELRRRNNIPEYQGTKGDIVLGRHTWKEYIRGLHEGWLGPLTAPPEPPKLEPPPIEKAEGAEEEKKEEDEKKPTRPPQPKPYNTVDDYPSSPLPVLIPAELGPAAPIRFPHILGFLNTPTRTHRYFTRRHLADEIGREVASACLATHREFLEEQQKEALAHEENDWVKTVFKEDNTSSDDAEKAAEEPKRERTWAMDMVLDPRIAQRMRRFELRPDDEERTRQIVVSEEEIEGTIKRHLRQMWRWGVRQWTEDKNKGPNVGSLDDE